MYNLCNFRIKDLLCQDWNRRYQTGGELAMIGFVSSDPVALLFTWFYKWIVTFRECVPICTEPVYYVVSFCDVSSLIVISHEKQAEGEFLNISRQQLFQYWFFCERLRWLLMLCVTLQIMPVTIIVRTSTAVTFFCWAFTSCVATYI